MNPSARFQLRPGDLCLYRAMTELRQRDTGSGRILECYASNTPGGYYCRYCHMTNGQHTGACFVPIIEERLSEYSRVTGEKFDAIGETLQEISDFGQYQEWMEERNRLINVIVALENVNALYASLFESPECPVCREIDCECERWRTGE